MDVTLEWINQEEGWFLCSEAELFGMVLRCFVTGREEAELKIQDVVSEGRSIINEKISQKIILKMIECIKKCFRLLWEEGYEETVLVEKKGSEFSEILDSTDVVQKCYSEYMMRQRIEPQKATICGPDRLELTEDDHGFCCTNKEKSFFCRMLPYTATEGGQSFYLYEVEVEKRKRNRGIATGCLSTLFRQLAREQALTVYLQVGSYNEPAVHLYRKLGFEISEEFCYYIIEE